MARPDRWIVWQQRWREHRALAYLALGVALFEGASHFHVFDWLSTRFPTGYAVVRVALATFVLIGMLVPRPRPRDARGHPSRGGIEVAADVDPLAVGRSAPDGADATYCSPGRRRLVDERCGPALVASELELGKESISGGSRPKSCATSHERWRNARE